MRKLYLSENGRITRYHEAWIVGIKIVQHWGPIGERGESLSNACDVSLSDEQNIEKSLAPRFAQGYRPLALQDHWLLEVQYRVAGMGTADDLEKRHALEDRLNELLGWTGLGHVDGGSIGSNTMEAACLVVDPGVAKRVIADGLRNTAFGDYAKMTANRLG